MSSITSKRGPGILLVGLYTPMTLPEEVIEQGGNEILEAISSRAQIFDAIYLYRNSFDSHFFINFYNSSAVQLHNKRLQHLAQYVVAN